MKTKEPNKVKVVEVPKSIYKGNTKSFRFRNPEGHMDKYNWITLKKGDEIPAIVQPILDKESELKKAQERVEELERDLADDGKANNSQNKEKNSPGRKKR